MSGPHVEERGVEVLSERDLAMISAAKWRSEVWVTDPRGVRRRATLVSWRGRRRDGRRRSTARVEFPSGSGYSVPVDAVELVAPATLLRPRGESL